MALTNDKPDAKKIACDNCESDEIVESRCNDCGIFLCQFCTESHKRSRSTKQHELLTMEDLKSNPGPQKFAEKVRCPKHTDEIIKLFCETCEATICRDCTIVDHQGHKYRFVQDVAVEKKEHLQSNLDEVKERKGRLVQGIVNLKKFDESLEAKKSSTISEIHQHFDQLANAVESRKMEMVEQATSLANSKQKQIHEHLEVLEVALASCDSSIEFTERAFRSGNDVQILSMEKCISQSLEQLKAVKDQTKPRVKEDMMFVIPSSVQETKEKLLNQYYVDVGVASSENCQASFKEEEKIFGRGKQYSITLVCNDKNNRRLTCGGQDIKPSFTGVEVGNVAVTDNKDGSYAIRFCPRQDGMLKFEVSINGVPSRKCSLRREVKWVISEVHGKGAVTKGGLTMTGVGGHGEYCWRVGGCYFESGVHTWKVQLSNSSYSSGDAEVGIIDCDEIDADVANSEKKWVLQHCVKWSSNCEISLKLDMGKRSLKVSVKSGYSVRVQNFQFTAYAVFHLSLRAARLMLVSV